MLKRKPASHSSLVHILPKSAPIPSLAYDSQVQTRLALQSAAHYTDFIFHKRSARQFFRILKCKSNSGYSAAPFCRPHQGSECDSLKWKPSSHHSPAQFLPATVSDRSLPPRKRRPYFSEPGSHFTLKDDRVTRPKMFSQGNSRVHMRSLHADVVDMMRNDDMTAPGHLHVPPEVLELGFLLICMYAIRNENCILRICTCIIQGSLDVKLPTIWTDGKAEV